MDNEKYGIELDLVLDKFRSKMQQVKSSIQGVGEKKINLTANTAQLRYIKSQIEEIQYLLSKADKGFEVGDTLKLEAQLEKLTQQYNKLIGKQKELQATSTIAHNNIEKGLDRSVTKIKRFGLALLSVRSIYSLVSRASSAYLAQDTELANKLQAAWVGLGAILAPIINFIATLILKLVSVINMVVKALTGVDLIAKASGKSMKGAAGSAKSLQKALTGFDELQNLDTDAGGGGAGGLNWADAFADIDTDWSKMIQGFYDTLDKISNNGVKKIQDAKKKAVDILTDMGFSPMVINGFSNMMDGISQLWEGLIRTVKGVFEIIEGIVTLDLDKIKKGFGDFFGGLKEMWTGWSNVVGGIVEMVVGVIKQMFDNAKNWIYSNFIQPVINWFSNMWGKVKDGAANAKNWITTQIDRIKSGFKSLVDSVKSYFSNLWSNMLSGFSSKWNKIANSLNKVGGKIGLPSLPTVNSYAVGTNYVPEDQLAFIHKGEAVVPKKYNKGSYQPVNNDETNYLLQQVITAINNIEINPYTTVKDVGKASLNYINSKSRQLGESVVV